MRILSLLITLPLAVILIAVAVANRAPVILSLDPFSRDQPALAIELPLYLALFACLGLGVILGGLVAWWAGLKRRRALKRHGKALAQDLKNQTKTAPATGSGAQTLLPPAQS